MSTQPIQNCRFEFQCPGSYSNLSETADPNVRFCSQCSTPVYRCTSLHELVAHTQAGHCVVLGVRRCSSENTRPGDVVHITSGTFENFEATIENIDAENDAAEVRVHVFGRVTPTWLPMETLGHVEE